MKEVSEENMHTPPITVTVLSSKLVSKIRTMFSSSR